jgi:hypothetical protein
VACHMAAQRRRAMAVLTKGGSHGSFGKCDNDDDQTITYI